LERKRRRIARILYGAILLGMGVGVVHLGREWEKEELEGKKHVEAVRLPVHTMNFKLIGFLLGLGKMGADEIQI